MTLMSKGPPLPPEVAAEVEAAMGYKRGLGITREWFERKVSLEDGCEVGAGYEALPMPPKPARGDFQLVLRQRRDAAGLSLTAAAKIAGVTKAHLHDLESGRSRNPGIATLVGLERALRVSVSYLALCAAAEFSIPAEMSAGVAAPSGGCADGLAQDEPILSAIRPDGGENSPSCTDIAAAGPSACAASEAQRKSEGEP